MIDKAKSKIFNVAGALVFTLSPLMIFSAVCFVSGQHEAGRKWLELVMTIFSLVMSVVTVGVMLTEDEGN